MQQKNIAVSMVLNKEKKQSILITGGNKININKLKSKKGFTPIFYICNIWILLSYFSYKWTMGLILGTYLKVELV